MRKSWLQGTSVRWHLVIPGILLFMATLNLATAAYAHRVIVFAYTEGDTLHTESKFVPNTPVRQGKILVMEEKSGKVLLTGQTDDKGKFSGKLPPEALKMDLKVVVEAAMGHRGEWALKAK